MSTDAAGALARSAGVVGGATLASRVLGLARDVVLANLFAAGHTDAFFVAFMIPNLFRRLVGEGSLTVAFVPIFTGWLRGPRAEARRVFNATWTLAGLVGLAIAVGGVLASGPLIGLFAPGFAADPAKYALAVDLLRLCFPYILLLVLVAVAMGALNASGHFLAPAAAPVLLNLCLIGAALGLAGRFDPPVLALGVGVIAAGVLQVLVQIPPLRRHGLSPRPVWDPGHAALRRLATVMAPAVLGASVFQLNLLVNRFLASFGGDGAVSYLYYADRLLEFPLGVFVLALGTASLPSLARHVKARDGDGLRGAFAATLGLALALSVPSAIGLVMLREHLFAALFAWNPDVFDSRAAAGCARALLFYAPGLVPITVSRIYVNLCLAHENTRTGARAAGVSLAVNAVASLMLIGPLPHGVLPDALIDAQHALALADLGYAGLALATTLAATANALYVALAAHRLYPGVLGGAEARARWALLPASALLVAAVAGVRAGLGSPGAASVTALAGVAAAVLAGSAAYFAVLLALRSPDARALMGLLRR